LEELERNIRGLKILVRNFAPWVEKAYGANTGIGNIVPRKTFSGAVGHVDRNATLQALVELIRAGIKGAVLNNLHGKVFAGLRHLKDLDSGKDIVSFLRVTLTPQYEE
jgi:hypothetical protein